MNGRVVRNWVRAGIGAGLVACVTYPLLVLVPMPRFLTAIVLAAFGPSLGFASVGLYHFLKLHRDSVIAQIAALSNRPSSSRRCRRTAATGHTVGEVIDVSATVRVAYPAGPGPFAEVKRALFTKQIVIAGTGNRSFIESGDSGVVVYENVKSCPWAVGLLFAGNDEVAVANPMKFVLAQARKIRPRGAPPERG